MNNSAVVILNWNGQKLLEQFLPSIIQHSGNAQIYVADNASTDTSISFIQSQFPQVQIIQNRSNFGFAQGYNEALKQVHEPIFVLVNSDIEVTENWLTPIEKLLHEQSNVAIVQPKILDFKDKTKFEYAGAAGGFIDRLGYPYCRGRIFDCIEEDLGQYNDTQSIFWASGACFGIRKNVFTQLQGFDTDFFAHQEEIDLCWRAINLGHEIVYCSESTVYHVGGATLQASNPQKTYLNFRNSLCMLTKNLPLLSLLPILFIRLVMDGLAGIQFLLQGKAAHCWAIVRAHFGFYSLFAKMWKKRSAHQELNYYKINSIVFRYFVRKQRKFNDLFLT
ncbi:MAG: glycosyltransferase family 2 protein [Flavobacterium sp.]|nr:glycosyltransferase family 2 protein [Flavobacterium sp.]